MPPSPLTTHSPCLTPDPHLPSLMPRRPQDGLFERLHPLFTESRLVGSLGLPPGFGGEERRWGGLKHAGLEVWIP